MEVIVHIGYPKTASTWFQKEYFPKVKNFRYIDSRYAERLICERNFFSFNPVEIRNTLSKDTNIIISSERIVSTFQRGWMYGSLAAINAQKTKSIFPNAKIILFLRRQQSIICSAYMQYIKNGGSYKLKKYIYGGDNIKLEQILYDGIIEYYDSLFGKDSIFIYLYEDFLRTPLIFLDKMNDDLGLNINTSDVSLTPINVGLRKDLFRIIRFINHFSTNLSDFKKVIIPIRGVHRLNKFLYRSLNSCSIMGDFLNEKNMLNKSDLDFISDYYKNSNQKLAQRIGAEGLIRNGYYL